MNTDHCLGSSLKQLGPDSLYAGWGGMCASAECMSGHIYHEYGALYSWLHAVSASPRS